MPRDSEVEGDCMCTEGSFEVSEVSKPCMGLSEIDFNESIEFSDRSKNRKIRRKT